MLPKVSFSGAEKLGNAEHPKLYGLCAVLPSDKL